MTLLTHWEKYPPDTQNQSPAVICQCASEILTYNPDGLNTFRDPPLTLLHISHKKVDLLFLHVSSEKNLHHSPLDLCHSSGCGYSCQHTSLQVFRCGESVHYHQTTLWYPKERLGHYSLSSLWSPMCLAACCNSRSWRRGWRRGWRRRSPTAHRLSPLTRVYFCRAPPFIFTGVLMSILMCLLCYVVFLDESSGNVWVHDRTACAGETHAGWRGCVCVHLNLFARKHTLV